MIYAESALTSDTQCNKHLKLARFSFLHSCVSTEINTCNTNVQQQTPILLTLWRERRGTSRSLKMKHTVSPAAR